VPTAAAAVAAGGVLSTLAASARKVWGRVGERGQQETSGRFVVRPLANQDVGYC
jgi:hypothetical protein